MIDIDLLLEKNKQSIERAPKLQRVPKPFKEKNWAASFQAAIDRRRISNAFKRAPETRRRLRNKHLKEAFGISIDEYEAMIVAQSGKCAICGIDSPRKDRVSSWPVDHDHITGQVR